MQNTLLQTTPALTVHTQHQPEAAAVENPDTTNYTADDTVTVAEARKRLGKNAPSRDAFHKAVKRGKLQKLPQQGGVKDISFRWGDILEYIANGGFKKQETTKNVPLDEPAPCNEIDTAPQESLSMTLEPAPPSTTPEINSVIITQAPRETMNGKPILYRDGETVLTIPSEKFHEKLLCDGIVMNLGDACVFNCSFCYVPAQMIKLDKPIIDAYNRETGKNLSFEDVVIRRRDSIEVLKSQLLNSSDGSRIYDDPDDNRVVYSSSLVDVAANMELLKETAEACNLILEHTNWQIRLLSKSSLLKLLVEREMIPKKYHHRLILGFSIGTLDDKVAAAIECGTAIVSKRLEALHWLQDHGIRTFGMICPSLPQDDYDKFSREMCAAIRVEKCEHVWAEVINVRGESLKKTLDALSLPVFESVAKRLKAVSGPKAKKEWENYARATFLAHTKNIPPEKLRFLQYIDRDTAAWWKDQRDHGAVLLGEEANISQLTAGGESAPSEPLPSLEPADSDYLAEREAIVDSGVKASAAAAKALHEIRTYGGGRLWRKNFRSFEQYMLVKWGYEKSQGYRLVELGGFVADLVCKDSSPNGEKLPVNEGQVRPMFKIVPKEHRVACWSAITADKNPSELTGPMVASEAKKFARKNGLEVKAPKSTKPTLQELAKRGMEKFRSDLEKLPQPERFNQLLLGIGILIDENPDEGVIEVTATEVEPAPGPASVEDIRQSA